MSNFKKWAGRVSALSALTVVGALGLSGIAAADNISNSIDATAEVMPLNVGGASGTTTLAIEPTNGDGKNGCNLIGSTVLNVAVVSSDTSVATVSPSSITFDSCGDTPTLTVTPQGVGSSTISLAQTANTTGGSFDLAPATFTVNVSQPAPANTAPTLSISGVTEGSSYDVGSVPAATCDVTDSEDGDSSFAATLSDVTGPDAADGIGSQTASCSYTDGGGLTAKSSVTYSIVDPTAPTIDYVLTPATPDGLNGWYTGDVTLDWTVTEGESPSSLSTSGCYDVTVSADQLATDYTCSASSAGGSATPVTVTIQRDGNGPLVAYDSTVSGTEGDNGWYTSDVTVLFTAKDGFSGVVPDSQEATTSGEGDAVTVDSPAFTDLAGNTTSAGAATSPTFKIDKIAPHDLTFSGGPADGGSYVFGDVPGQPTCDATDDVSGLAGCVVTGGGTSVGPHTYTATATDQAGNVATRDLSYTVLPWTMAGFYQPVNMNGTWNTVKGGSTVPLKFEIFAGSTEKTDVSAVKSFTQTQVACPNSAALTDAIEITTTGGTNLRYDTTAGQFVQNWATPKKPGACYTATMTAQDGSRISAYFILK